MPSWVCNWSTTKLFRRVSDLINGYLLKQLLNEVGYDNEELLKPRFVLRAEVEVDNTNLITVFNNYFY